MTENKLKTCYSCKQKLDLSCFHNSKINKDGLCGSCKTCVKVRVKKWCEENQKRSSAIKSQWQERNSEKHKLSNLKWRESNLESVREKARLRAREKYKQDPIKALNRTKKWRADNQEKVLAIKAARRASKKNATPKWLTKEHFEEIQDFYLACKAFRLFTGLSYHVDHIIPLTHPLVCGLHVPWNLQILEASENNRKYNHFEIE